ncbi:MAG TPA: alpha/beta hydrolase [Candidatus Limnocylindrales bacterium]|jgi:pimeloyl-ACP methyl ester carboxylesterase|nr:alpha/beta hydrolase [Candidatus Limnocylindrales bacterium]
MKTRWESCVFFLLMLLPGIWLLTSTLWPAETTVFAHNRVFGGQAAQNSSPLAGEWQGMVSRLHLKIDIGSTGEGSYTGKLTSVDQGNITIPIDTITFANNSLHFEMKSIAATYDGKMSENKMEIEGTWQQGGRSIPLVLRRPGAGAAAFTLKSTTMGRVALTPCRTPDGNTEGLCGKYEVFENREAKSGRKIALNIMVLPANAPKAEPDPFVPLAGGPGQGAIEAFPLVGFVGKIRQHRDVVLVDQRGSGGSNPLPCVLRDPSDPQSMLGELIPIEKLRACRAELEKKADLTQYTTSIWADDLDEVRQALGYEKINVFGGSYGTRAALVYLRRHSDRVRTISLEGVVPPDYRLPVSFSRTIQDSVNKLLDRCATDETCKKEYPDLRKEFETVVQRLDKEPAKFQLKTASGIQTVTLPRGGFIANLRPLLYVPEVVSQFPYFVHHAYKDDWAPYAYLAITIRDAIDKSIDRGLSFSVVCTEDVPGITEAMVRRDTAGTWLGDYQVRMFQKACETWPRGKAGNDVHAEVHSDVPALLVSGAFDPATPPQISVKEAKDFSNGRVVIVKDGTHGTGSPCIDGLLSDFVAQGSAKGLDAACTDQIHLPPFLTEAQAEKAKGQ